jgi:transketolase
MSITTPSAELDQLCINTLRFHPANPQWHGRNRFVLSAGDGSMLLYTLLYMCGYGLPLEEIKRFRQWGSLTPGHPERGLTPGIETTTGRLGRDLAMPLAWRWRKHIWRRFSRPGFENINQR